MAKKTDNHNPEAKLKLRRHFLETYHADGSAKVFDCCQGGGVMWSALRQTHPIASYWGVDVKPKKGRLKIDSVRVLQQGISQDVIDIDTYGSPWKHWFAMLPKVTQPVTVFLTRGSHSLEVLDEAERIAVGITFEKQIPPAFWPKLQLIDRAANALLTTCYDTVKIVEAVEASSTGTARYYGVRLEPKENRPPIEAATCQQTQIVKGS